MKSYFPAKFIEKLKIYQDIRNGQGISKNKNLWEFEAAYLQKSYGEHHQHIAEYQIEKDAKKWIYDIAKKKPCDEFDQVMKGLEFKGFIDIVSEKNDKSELLKKGKIITNCINTILSQIDNSYNIQISYSSTIKKYRSTEKGLLVGEILSEINNKNPFIKFLNNYKYSLVIDILWLMALVFVTNFFSIYLLSNFINKINYGEYYPFLSNDVFKITFVLVIWPVFSFIFRKIIQSLGEDY